MKKSAIIALTVLLSFGLIIPVMAADLSVSGDFRARGFYKSNAGTDLNEDGTSDAYYDFRFRPVLKITLLKEKLSITTRAVIFDEQYGTSEGGRYTESSGTTDPDGTGKSDVASWDRAWATWVTDYGKLDVGRMSGGLFGLSLFETEETRDRIKWTMPLGPTRDFTLLGIIEKNGEDEGDGSLSDSDSDAFYLAGIYNKNEAEVGLLLGSIRKEVETPVAERATTSYTLVNPYFDVKKLADGNLGLKGEVQYRTGSISPKATGGQDTDISAMGFYLAVTYDFGKFDAELGYANAAGDDEENDNEIGSLGGLGVLRSGLGDEWTPLVVLQDVNALLDEGGNTGVSLFYLCGNYEVNDDVTVSGVFGSATPNAKQFGTDNDEAFGNEIDLKLAWKLVEGPPKNPTIEDSEPSYTLTYKFNFGYLMAGDFFKDGNDDPENTYTIYHGLEFEF
jgi:hypothetical protein